MMRRLLLYLFAVGAFLLPASSLHARERVQGWCEQGGNTLTVVGLETTDTTQQSFPGCTVTVWDAGTMDIASIFSDDVGTVKANSFTADATTGLWFFYADNARYDVQLSGAGIAVPFTLADFSLDDSAQTVTTIAVVASSATPVFDVGKASILTNILTANVTSSTITNGVTGQVITIHIAQDGTGGWTFAWPADVVLRTGALVVADDASAVTVATFYYTGTEWREIGVDSDEIGRDILPVTTGRNLGSGAARWDFFGQVLDVAGMSVLTGDVTFGADITSNILPSATGQNLGSATARWDALLETMTFYDTVAPNVTGVDIGTTALRPDGFFDVFAAGRANNVRKCDSDKYVGADAGAKIASCIADLLVGGGIADARGFEGAQTAAATLTISKPVHLLVGAATFTWSVQPAIVFGAGSDGSSLICTNKSKITFIDSIPDFSDLVRVTASSKVTIRGCDLDGNGVNAQAGQQNTGIRVHSGSTDVLIEGNILNDSQGDGITLGDAERVKIVHNTFFDNQRSGVTLFGPTINEITITDNEFREGSATGGAFVHGEGAITVGAGVGIVVADNRMDGIGISFETTGDPWKRVTISGNEIFGDRTGDPIITLRDVQDFTVTGNVIKGDSSDVRIGIQIFEGAGALDTGRGVISGNTIIDVGSHGIIFTGTLEPALGSVIVSNNIIASPGGNGIFVDTDWPNLTIQGNVIFDCTSQGIVFADSQYFTIAGNTVRNCGTGAGIQIDLLGGTAAGIGTVYGNVVSFDTLGTTKGIQVGNNANIDRILIFGNDLADTNTPLSIGASATNIHAYMNRTATTGAPVWTSNITFTGVIDSLEGTLSNQPRWIFKLVDHTDMIAAATADDFVLWTLPANTMIHNVVGRVQEAWAGTGPVTAAVCSVGTVAGTADDLALDDNFFATGTRYELHDATVDGGKGTLLFDPTDKFAPRMLVSAGDIEIQCDLTGGNHADTTAGQARVWIRVSQPLANITTEAN